MANKNLSMLIIANNYLQSGNIMELYSFGEGLIGYQDPEVLYEFANMCKKEKYCQTSGLMYKVFDELGACVCEIGNPEFILKYARDVAYNKDRYLNKICEIGDAEYIYEFARQVPKANIKVLTKALILCDDDRKVEYMKKFQNLNTVDKESMQKYIDMFSKQDNSKNDLSM